MQVNNISDELYLSFSDPCNYSRQSLWSMWTDKHNSILKEEKKTQQNKTAYSTCLKEVNQPLWQRYYIIYNYPIIILNVDISLLFNKVMHHFDAVTFSCQVQGSYLLEKKKVIQNSSNLHAKCLVCKLFTTSPLYNFPIISNFLFIYDVCQRYWIY